MHFPFLSSVVVIAVVVGLFITINLSVRLLHHYSSYFLPFAFVLIQYFHTSYSTDALKTVWYEVSYTENQGLLS